MVAQPITPTSTNLECITICKMSLSANGLMFNMVLKFHVSRLPFLGSLFTFTSWSVCYYDRCFFILYYFIFIFIYGGTRWRTSWRAEAWKRIWRRIDIFGVWEWMDGSWLCRSYIYISLIQQICTKAKIIRFIFTNNLISSILFI